jgi:hypothetical protein
MADHFVLMTGRLLTEETLQSAIHEATAVTVPSTTAAGYDQPDPSSHVHLDMGKVKTGVMVECRICQEEGDEAYMETPCSCQGSLKASFLCFIVLSALERNFCFFFFLRSSLIVIVGCRLDFAPVLRNGSRDAFSFLFNEHVIHFHDSMFARTNMNIQA